MNCTKQITPCIRHVFAEHLKLEGEWSWIGEIGVGTKMGIVWELYGNYWWDMYFHVMKQTECGVGGNVMKCGLYQYKKSSLLRRVIN